MSGQFYDNALRTSYHIPIAVTTTAGDLLEGIAGPEGKVGRVRALYAAVTTVYVGTDTISLDSVTPSLTTPPTLAITGADNLVVHATAAALQGFSDLTADTSLALATDGLSTSGVSSITLVIDWY
jgi:hypothetical protein